MARAFGSLRPLRAIRRGLATRIFICYRRDGTAAGYALDVRNRLAAVLGARNVFLDVAGDAIDIGQDWKGKVRDAIDQSTTVIVLIDRHWGERLASPDDPVRFELTTALAGRARKQIHIFPVLVGDARMPSPNDLPAALVDLADLSASHIRTATPDNDVAAIVRRLTGRASAEPILGPDRYDAGIAAGAFATAIAVWLSFLRDQFNTNEKWLWGIAIALLAIIACALRRAATSLARRQRS